MGEEMCAWGKGCVHGGRDVCMGEEMRALGHIDTLQGDILCACTYATETIFLKRSLVAVIQYSTLFSVTNIYI